MCLTRLHIRSIDAQCQDYQWHSTPDDMGKLKLKELVKNGPQNGRSEAVDIFILNDQ